MPSTQLVQGLWTLDPTRSVIGFQTHGVFGLFKATGGFERYQTRITVGASAAESSIAVVIDTDSISTGIKLRDKHLRADNVFAATRFPTIEFHSATVAEHGNGLEVTGSLRVRDVTRPISFHADRPPGTDLQYSFTATVAPKDFGITRPGTTNPVTVTVDATLIPA